MKTIHFLIKGRVQGVGFRWFVKQHAEALGITGWVQNTPEGEVKGILQGDEQQLQALLEKIRQGPSLSKVTTVTVQELQEKQHYEQFTIRY